MKPVLVEGISCCVTFFKCLGFIGWPLSKGDLKLTPVFQGIFAVAARRRTFEGLSD